MLSTKLTIKQRLGAFLIPRVPVSRHVFDHLRLEVNALRLRLLLNYHPLYRMRAARIARRMNVKVNAGCGPFGKPGWINIDLHPHEGVTITADCRRKLPCGNDTCEGIHAEHFFEHLSHADERGVFLAECLRCLKPGGILRIIVPDAERFVLAYTSEGWDAMRSLNPCSGENFATKMEALNHVFLQGYEHFGGYDFLTLRHALEQSGFENVQKRSFGEGAFPGGCIDREQHSPYSLYAEAQKPGGGEA